jgi:hypothetical protein
MYREIICKCKPFAYLLLNAQPVTISVDGAVGPHWTVNESPMSKDRFKPDTKLATVRDWLMGIILSELNAWNVLAGMSGSGLDALTK